MQKLLFGLCAFVLFLVSCARYETVDCKRGTIILVTVGPHDSIAQIHIEAHQKGANFGVLVKERTYQLNQMVHNTINQIKADSIGHDTILHYAKEVNLANDFFKPKPDAYDWRITNLSTGKVYLVTDIEQWQNTIKLKKGDPNLCFTSVKNYKVNGILARDYTNLFGQSIIVFVNI